MEGRGGDMGASPGKEKGSFRGRILGGGGIISYQVRWVECVPPSCDYY